MCAWGWGGDGGGGRLAVQPSYLQRHFAGKLGCAAEREEVRLEAFLSELCQGGTQTVDTEYAMLHPNGKKPTEYAMLHTRGCEQPAGSTRACVTRCLRDSRTSSER